MCDWLGTMKLSLLATHLGFNWFHSEHFLQHGHNIGLREDLVQGVDWDIDWDVNEEVRGHVGDDGRDEDVGDNRSCSTPLFEIQEGQVSIFLESVVCFLLK